MFRVIDMPVKEGFDLRALFINIGTKEKSFISFEVNPSLKPYILELRKNFTCYFFDNISRLNSSFSIRIYEFLKQFQNIKTLKGWARINVKELRDFIGIAENKYVLYGHFKSRVLLTAQKELHQKTDIMFNFQEVKEHRKVRSLIFEIKPNTKTGEIDNNIIIDNKNTNTSNNNILNGLFFSKEKDALYNDLIEQGVSTKIADNITYNITPVMLFLTYNPLIFEC